MLTLGYRTGLFDGDLLPHRYGVARIVDEELLGKLHVLLVLGVLDVALDRDRDRVFHGGLHDHPFEGLSCLAGRQARLLGLACRYFFVICFSHRDE